MLRLCRQAPIGWPRRFHFELTAVKLQKFTNHVRNARASPAPIGAANRDHPEDVQKVRWEVERGGLHSALGTQSGLRWSSFHIKHSQWKQSAIQEYADEVSAELPASIRAGELQYCGFPADPSLESMPRVLI